MNSRNANLIGIITVSLTVILFCVVVEHLSNYMIMVLWLLLYGFCGGG